MVLVHATVLGGLPVVADVWFTRGDGWTSDDDSGVDALYWRRHDGSKGSPLPQHIMDKIEKQDACWQSMVTEQANDWLGCHCPTRYRNPEYTGFSFSDDTPEWIEEGEYSDEYKLLNPRKFS